VLTERFNIEPDMFLIGNSLELCLCGLTECNGARQEITSMLDELYLLGVLHKQFIAVVHTPFPNLELRKAVLALLEILCNSKLDGLG
jgi:hypothetical protein